MNRHSVVQRPIQISTQEHSFNPSIQEVEPQRSLWVWGQTHQIVNCRPEITMGIALNILRNKYLDKILPFICTEDIIHYNSSKISKKTTRVFKKFLNTLWPYILGHLSLYKFSNTVLICVCLLMQLCKQSKHMKMRKSFSLSRLIIVLYIQMEKAKPHRVVISDSSSHCSLWLSLGQILHS